MKFHLALLLYIGFLWSWGQNRDTTYYGNYRLREVTVSTTRIPKNNLLPPFSVTRLDSIFLSASSQNLSIKESLQQVPGVYVQNAYNFAQDARISIRGFGATAAFGVRGIKLIVDGIPETTPDGTGQLDNLNLDIVGSMEVLRGTASSLYGNAAGGAILITSNFSFDRNFIESRSMVGSYGFYSQSISAGFKDKKTTYLAHVRAFGSDGYRANSEFEQVNVRFAVRHQTSEKLDLTLVAEYMDSPEANDAGGLTLDEARLDPSQARDRNLLFSAGESVSQMKVGVSANWNLSEGNNINTYAFFNRRVFDGKLPFEDQGVIALERNYVGVGNTYEVEKGGHALKIGYDFLSQQDHRRRYNNLEGRQGSLALNQIESFSNLGVYILDYFQLDAWYFSGGLRYDFNSLKAEDRFLSDGDDSGDQTLNNMSYHVGVARNLSRSTQVFLNHSNSFETPTLNQLSNRPDNAGGFEQLDAARASAFEGGLRWSDNQWKAEVVTFHTMTEEELVPYELEQFPERTFFRNAGSTQRVGVEFSLGYFSEFWRFNTSYSFADFSYQSFVVDGIDLDGFALPGIPANHFTLNLTAVPINSLEVSLPVDYVGSLFANDDNSVSVDRYLELGFLVRHTFELAGLQLSTFGGVRNLTNQAYFDNIRINAFGNRFYEPAPTRNVYAGLVIRLD